MRIELADCEKYILDEISNPSFKRIDIAKTYALILKSSEAYTVDWVKVNQAICDRWSFAGLKWIKNRAWLGMDFKE